MNNKFTYIPPQKGKTIVYNLNTITLQQFKYLMKVLKFDSMLFSNKFLDNDYLVHSGIDNTFMWQNKESYGEEITKPLESLLENYGRFYTYVMVDGVVRIKHSNYNENYSLVYPEDIRTLEDILEFEHTLELQIVDNSNIEIYKPPVELTIEEIERRLGIENLVIINK